MKNGEYLRYMVVFAVGIALILNYMRFISNYKELSNIDENFTYIYTDSDLPDGIVEECRKYQVDCEIWNMEKEKKEYKEGLTLTAAGYVICAENGIIERILFLNEESTGLEDGNADYSDGNDVKMIEGENLFLNSDFLIDVNLLKWMVYIIIFFCFFCIMVFCFCQNKKWGNKKWIYFVVMFIWFLYVRIFIFASIEDFPVWSLPGKWSDLEGWGKLGEEVLKQISFVFYFKDYPVICKYYEGVIKSIFYLFLSFILVYLFFKSSLRLRHFRAVHMVMTVIAFAVYVYCSDKEMKMLIYFLPCFIGSFIWNDG